GQELPAFVDALEHFFRRAAMKTARDLVPPTGLENASMRLAGLLAAGWPPVLVAHAGGQVVGAHEDSVNARNREDSVGILDCLDVLALEDDENLIVRVREIVGRRGSKV